MPARKLVVVGDGPEMPSLRKRCPPNVELRGRLSDDGVEAELQSARAFTGDIIEVRCVAADHAPEGHEGIVTAAAGQLARHHRQLERARHAHHRKICGRATALEPCARGALEQTRHDDIVEARRHDRDLAPAGSHFALDELRGRHPSSPT